MKFPCRKENELYAMNRAFLNMKHEVKALVFRQTNAFMDPI